jgi:hypothetical protein
MARRTAKNGIGSDADIQTNTLQLTASSDEFWIASQGDLLRDRHSRASDASDSRARPAAAMDAEPSDLERWLP